MAQLPAPITGTELYLAAILDRLTSIEDRLRPPTVSLDVAAGAGQMELVEPAVPGRGPRARTRAGAPAPRGAS